MNSKKTGFAANLENLMEIDYDREYDRLEGAPKDLKLPPTADETKATV